MSKSELEEWRRRYPLQAGEVALVGAGPGDPGLLTLRALAIVQQAEVVLYDNLVSPEILALVPESAERIFVGKERNHHHKRQEEICALLIALAKSGRRVVRLKAGDPYIFGRGGEEAEALARAGVRCQVVPGITAAVGAAAYSGIPLTHRYFAHACVFVTGHNHNNQEEEIDWASLACPNLTVAFYMGRHNLSQLCARLIAYGRDPLTPAAIIERATTPHQRVVTGTLQTLPSLADALAVGAPSIVLVGEVVRCRSLLNSPQRFAEQRQGREQTANITSD
ncbi:MAG: uroporphyrinogen-III C-methyltransferase [Hydrogenophilus sp.]|nr:uroporphyrinogen-III C-methyltransferase [Hydrogenophilus sp.]